MINEEKVVLMTKASLFEKKQRKKAIKITRYFRWDYISLQLLRGWISVTIAFGLVAALWSVCHLEYLFENLNKMDLKGLATPFIMSYAAVTVGYLVILTGVSTYRYSKAHRAMNSYVGILKKISRVYADEEKPHAESTRTRGGKK